MQLPDHDRVEEIYLLAAWKKVLLFGLFGAAGCVAGWAVGEAYLSVARAATNSAAVEGPSLISKGTTPPTAPPPSDTFRTRLEAAGAKTGDVQISLVWYNENDLDLHCIDPNNEEISFRHRRSRSGGELDVDANRDGPGLPITAKPVENIYWPRGGAPRGRYQVYVNHYKWRPDRAPNDTRFDVSILRGTERTDFTNLTIHHRGGAPDDNRQLIFEFNLAPRIEVFAAAELALPRGASLKVPVAIRRTFVQGAVEVTAENLPDGVTATKTTIAEGNDEGEIELKAGESARHGKNAIKIVATTSNAGATADAELRVQSPRLSAVSIIIIGIWTALLAVGLCVALLVGQNRYLGRPLLAAGRVPLAAVIAGGAAAGLVSGSLGQALFSVFLAIGVGSLGLVFGWVLLGGLLGFGISYTVPNLDRKKAAVAGLAGGLLGVIVYLLWSLVAEWLGRFAGAAALGFCIGLAVAIVEAAFRRVWLEVRYGDRESITVNLGPEPVKVGGDAKGSTVWARGAAGVALRYFVRDDRVICEDVPTRTETVVGNGHTRTVGTVTLIVRTAAGPQAVPVTRVEAAPAAVPRGGQTPSVRPEVARVDPPPVKKAPEPPDLDDGLPMPISPPPPPRPAVKSILDDDGYVAVPPPIAPVPVATGGLTPPTRPEPAPPPPARPTPAPAKAVVGVKPPVPAAPTKLPKPVVTSSPSQAAKPATDVDACPTCGRKSPGQPGARFCMMCDKTY